jgi:hypothetical protein
MSSRKECTKSWQPLVQFCYAPFNHFLKVNACASRINSTVSKNITEVKGLATILLGFKANESDKI